MQGNFDTLSKNLFQLPTPLTTGSPVPCFLRTRRPSPAMVTSKRFLSYSGNELGGHYMTGPTFRHPHLWDQQKQITESSPIFWNPTKASTTSSNKVVTFPRSHFGETCATTQHTIWGRDATRSIEIPCTLPRFEVKCMGQVGSIWSSDRQHQQAGTQAQEPLSPPKMDCKSLGFHSCITGKCCQKSDSQRSKHGCQLV